MPLKRSSSPNHTKFTVVRLDNNLYRNTKNIMNNWKRKKKKLFTTMWREENVSTLTWIWLRSTAARRIMALARLWNSLPIWRDFSNVVLLWSTSLAYRIYEQVRVPVCQGSNNKVPVATVWCVQRFHLAVGVDTCINETLQYELGELVLQSCYCCVERLSHLGHVCWHVGAEILGGGENRKPTHKKNISAQKHDTWKS